ncbi:MAG: hypothetical protein ACO1QS_19735 [Verrucomicrobiota bacterium]
MQMPADNSSGRTPSKPPPLPDEAAEASRLGLNLEVYRRLKQQSKTGDVAAELRAMTEEAAERGEQTVDDDIAHEEATYRAMQREKGIFKKRGEAPGFIRAASRTPGEVAKGILFCLAYLVQLCLIGIWLERVGRQDIGALWFPILGVLVITSFIISGAIWRLLGERAREVIRGVVRFWPVTFPLILFVGIGLVKWLFGGAGQ